MKKNSSAAKTAFCGVMSALCLALMLISSLVPFLTYAMPALSGVLLIVVALSMGQSASLIIYICVSALSLLFVTDKECALLFVCFFGYYPFLKLRLDGMQSKLLRVVCKFLLFNTEVLLSQALMIYVFGIPLELLAGLGLWTIPVLLLLANMLFMLYDCMLSQLRRVYCLKWHRYVERFFRI